MKPREVYVSGTINSIEHWRVLSQITKGNIMVSQIKER
jgi:hypothetical protein